MRATWVLSVATAFALLGASILVFLNPVWVGFEQGRAGVERDLGLRASLGACAGDDLGPITDPILHDLILGGDFGERFPDSTTCGSAHANAGAVVLTGAEQGHMRDVRGVFQGFYLLVALSVIALVLTFRRWRDPAARATWWRAVRRGVAGLAVAVAVLGVVSLVAFDAAFELFHRLFFAPGSYDFDPATSRLIQLFPDQFWSDTTVALGVVVLVASWLVAWLATRRLGALAASARPTGASTPALQVGKAAR